MGLNDWVTNYVRDRLREVAGDPSPSRNGNGGDALDQIRKLGELREAGLITTAEFEAKKLQLLERV